MRTVIALGLVFTLVGCSTTPVEPSIAKQVVVEKSFQVSTSKIPVTIVRDKGMVASACAITVYIDGEKVAELDTQEKAVAYVNPGAIIVGAGFMGKGLCSGAPRNEREFLVKEDQPRVLRIFIDQSGNVDILPTTLN